MTDSSDPDTDTSRTAPPTDDGSQDQDPAERGRAYLTALAVANGQAPPKSEEIDGATARAIGTQLSGRNPGGNGADDAPRTAGDVNSASVKPRKGVASNSHRRGTMGGAMFGGSDHRRGFGGPGFQYGTRRDVWDVLGYPEFGDPHAADYIARARRQDPAYVVANKPVEASWKLSPRIVDDSHDSEADDETQFEQDLSQLLNAETDLFRGLLHYLEWADREQRPGQYGLLFIGFDDGRKKSEPVDVSKINGPEDVKYFRPFNQSNVESWTLAGELEGDEVAEYMPPGTEIGEEDYLRPDMPVEYNVRFAGRTASGELTSTSKVIDGEEDEAEAIHWTRVVHIVEKPTVSEFIGESCLEPILNRLIDFEKVVGASAEMYWSGADRKYFLSAGGGQDLVDDEDIEWLDEQFQLMSHDMRQAVYTQNMEFDVIDGQAVDPSGIIDSLYQSMSGVSGLPQRIMTGSERGDLASSLDQATWFGRIHERQKQFCEPSILRPVVDLLIQYGALTPPSNSDATYTVEWQSLFELTDIEKANLGLTISRTFKELENAIAMGCPRDMAYAEAGYEFPEDELAEREEIDMRALDPEEPEERDMPNPDTLPEEEAGNEPVGDPSHGSGDGDGAGGGETRPANRAGGRNVAGSEKGAGVFRPWNDQERAEDGVWSHADMLARYPTDDSYPTTGGDGDQGPAVNLEDVLSAQAKRELALRRAVLSATDTDGGEQQPDSASEQSEEAEASAPPVELEPADD